MNAAPFKVVDLSGGFWQRFGMVVVKFADPVHQELVSKAVTRSLSPAQLWTGDGTPALFIGDRMPAESHFQKVVVFGHKPDLAGPAETVATLGKGASGLRVEYALHRLTQNLFLREREFERYDFAREWNNLGYGRIVAAPGTPGSVASGGAPGDVFACVWNEPGRSVLWYNRNVGPIDGFDWRMVEDFFSEYRCRGSDALVTVPVLSEVPAGYSGAVTFRIDCDENIESGRPLFELYRDRGLPFSVAIKTDQKIDAGAVALMREILDAGGSVVSHSHTHAPDWGESQDKPGPRSQGAKWEAETSRELLEKALGISVRYAVSPFHQNPRRAVEGIRAGGIEAFVGGIICNDPEYLMARAGEVPFVPGVISHSQQCMLHGDSYHQAGNRLDTYFAALDSALVTGTFFGYLDHPFSSYQYGWKDEAERLKVHTQFLDRIASKPGIWFASLGESLDFLWDRAHAKVSAINGIFRHSRHSGRSSLHIAVRWNGNVIKLL